MPLNDRQKYLLGLGPNPEAEVASTGTGLSDREKLFRSNQANWDEIANELAIISKTGKASSLSPESVSYLKQILPQSIAGAMEKLGDRGFNNTRSSKIVRRNNTPLSLGLFDTLDESLYGHRSSDISHFMWTKPLDEAVKVDTMRDGLFGFFDASKEAKVNIKGGESDNALSYLNTLPDSDNASSPIQTLLHEFTHAIERQTGLGYSSSYVDDYYVRSNELLAEIASVETLKRNDGITKEDYDIKWKSINERLDAKQKGILVKIRNTGKLPEL